MRTSLTHLSQKTSARRVGTISQVLTRQPLEPPIGFGQMRDPPTEQLSAASRDRSRGWSQ